MRRTSLLIVTALGEGGIGVLLLVSPSIPLMLLLDVDQVSPEVAFLARIAGAALLALAVACYLGRSEHPLAQNGLLFAVLLYDLAATGILAHTGWFAGLAGSALWPAVGLHFGLAVWCATCLWRSSS